MTSVARSLALSVALAVAALGARAESSVASSVSDSVSTSVGQLSKSLNHSSDSSSHHENLAQGDYRIVDVAEAAGQPGMVAMRLQPMAEGAPEGLFTLTLPAATVAQAALAAGQVIHADARPYGLQFAKADTREPFFLVMEDAWYRELDSKQVS